MSTTQVFAETPQQRLRVLDPAEASGAGGAERTLTALTSAAEPPAGPDPAAPRAHGIRPAMHRWQIPRRERFAWRARIHANPASSLAYRVGVGALGVLLLALSALTGWLPGPGGIPLFLIGMAVLASEFRWAHRITVGVMMVVRHVECWPRRAKAIGVCVFGAVVMAGCYLALLVIGLPSGTPDWAVRALSHLPGVG